MEQAILNLQRRSFTLHLQRLLVALLLCTSPAFARAAGLQLITVPADAGGHPLVGAIWYPCAAPAAEARIGGLRVPAVKDCPLDGSDRPLIVISHGYSGRMTSHHDTAEMLADAGFVVAAINHPVDSGPDMTRADTMAPLTERPSDSKRLIDYMVHDWSGHAKLDPDRIGFFGFSRGGYTGLVLIGADPDIRKGIVLCQGGSVTLPICRQIRANSDLPTVFTHDPRIKAAVIADPAFGPMFTRQSLQGAHVPVQLWASEFSAENRDVGVTKEYVAAVRDHLPSKPEYHLVANAGHYAFLTPCPPGLAKELPQICTDRPGFDRTAFHREFDASVLAFLRAHLLGAG